MSDSSAIREFLITLGFKLDQPALKSFSEGISKATKAVVGLAAAVEGTATIVAAGVARFASNLEDLYFAAQRTGSSATQLMAFQRTAQNFGASADEARGSVEALAQSLRMNPGNVGLLQSLGVHLHRSKNGAYDATDALLQFGQAMRARGYFRPDQFYMAEQYGQQFGISERTLLALQNGGFGREFGRIQQEMRGNGFDKAARDAHGFMMSLRDLETQLQVFGSQIVDALQKKLGLNLKQLNAWIQKNGPRLAKELVDDVLLIISAAEWLGHKLLELIGWFERLDKDTYGWGSRLVELLAIMRLVGGFEIIGGIVRLTAAFVRLGSAILVASNASAGLRLLTGAGAVGAAGVGAYEGTKALSTWLGNKLGYGTDLGSALGGWLYGSMHRSDEAVQYFRMQGWTQAQAIGIVTNLAKESGLFSGARGDPDAMGNPQAWGLAQWHKDRQAQFRNIYGHDIKNSSFQEQLDFVQWELTHTESRAGTALKAATNAAGAARAVSLYYERPAGGLAEANKRAAAAVTISSQTDIHVHGDKDPAATAGRVESAQKRVNADTVRNFAARVQ